MKKAGWVALFLCAALWMVGVTGSAVEEGTPLPVLMYHALLRNPNAWNDYVLSPDALEQDLIWLKVHGYSFVLPSQVIGFVQNRNPLPEKPVMITLDDGCLNHLTYLPEILERQDACAFLSVVGAARTLASFCRRGVWRLAIILTTCMGWDSAGARCAVRRRAGSTGGKC